MQCRGMLCSGGNKMTFATLDLSQYDIASEVGGQPVVSDIFHGKRKLTRDHIERLAKRFGLRPATFFPG